MKHLFVLQDSVYHVQFFVTSRNQFIKAEPSTSVEWAIDIHQDRGCSSNRAGYAALPSPLLGAGFRYFAYIITVLMSDALHLESRR